ncbi:hypothetical protein Tco_0714891 [Tanacetum coccineum]
MATLQRVEHRWKTPYVPQFLEFNWKILEPYPAAGDLFYQRMLLCHQKGCKSFPDIRKVNEILYLTCRAACQALGLLEDDDEWENTMQEAACTATPAELRTLFAHILTFCQVANLVSLRGRAQRSTDTPYLLDGYGVLSRDEYSIITLARKHISTAKAKE